MKTSLPDAPDILTVEEIRASVAAIAALQTDEGLILWTPDGHADPWNHVETAMALDIGGLHASARLAYRWLADRQRADGSWFQYYTADGVEDHKQDANTVAYVATGVWHHYLSTADRTVLSEFWPTVEAAMDWVIELQQPTGEVIWAREADGSPMGYALLTGSASMAHSMGCAVAIAREMGKDSSRWNDARLRLANAVAHHPERFEPKDRWAMDWYYPVLAGVLSPEHARARLRTGWARFVMDGEGVRCVDDHPWVTTGETAEAAIACVQAGLTDEAASLLRWSHQLRADDGSYWTGLHVPDRVHFPADERTAYSAAAVVLALDALAGTTQASTLFRPATRAA
jgi:hypothetical protein